MQTRRRCATMCKISLQQQLARGSYGLAGEEDSADSPLTFRRRRRGCEMCTFQYTETAFGAEDERVVMVVSIPEPLYSIPSKLSIPQQTRISQSTPSSTVSTRQRPVLSALSKSAKLYRLTFSSVQLLQALCSLLLCYTYVVNIRKTPWLGGIVGAVMTSFIDFLDMISGRKSMPLSRFVSFHGQVGQDQLHSLAEVIVQNKVSGGMRIQGGEFGDAGAQVIAEALQANTKLHAIELPGNNIGVGGAQHFAEMLQDNFTITTLDLSDNPCQEAYCEEFDHSLWRNRNYLSADMENSPPSSTGPGSRTLAKSLILTPAGAQDSQGRQSMSAIPASAARLRKTSASPCLSLMSTAKSPTSEPSSPPVRSPSAPGGQLLLRPHPQADEGSQPCSPARSPSMSQALTPHRPVLQSIGPDAENQLNIAASAQGFASHVLRLHQLEIKCQAVSAEAGSIKEKVNGMAGWKDTVDAASNQVAAVLDDLQDQVLSVRSTQQIQRHWRGQVDTAGQHLRSTVEQLNDALYSMKRQVDLLAQAQQDAPFQSVQEEQQLQQSHILDLQDDVAAIKKDQEFLAAETGVSASISGVDMWNHIVRLEQDCDHFEEVTERLDKYVEEMLRKMLGTLDQGQCRLKAQVEVLAARVSRIERQQATLAQQAEPGHQQTQDQVLREVVERLQRTEAALGLAHQTSSTSTQQLQQAAAAPSRQHHPESAQRQTNDSHASDTESDTASEASVKHAIRHSDVHQRRRVAWLDLKDLADSTQAAAQAPQHQLPSPVSNHQTTSSPAALRRHQNSVNATSSTSDNKRDSPADVPSAALTPAQSQEPAAANIAAHNGAALAGPSAQPAASSSPLSRPSIAPRFMFRIQGLSPNHGQGQASISGREPAQLPASTGTSVLPSSTDLATGQLITPSSAAAGHSTHSSHYAADTSFRQSGGTEGLEVRQGTPAVSLQDQSEAGSTVCSHCSDARGHGSQQECTDDVANGREIVQKSCVVDSPQAGGKRLFGISFFRFRPDNNRFL